VDKKDCGIKSVEKIQTIHDDADDSALSRINMVKQVYAHKKHYMSRLPINDDERDSMCPQRKQMPLRRICSRRMLPSRRIDVDSH
jgi:hypothetical protein